MKVRLLKKLYTGNFKTFWYKNAVRISKIEFKEVKYSPKQIMMNHNSMKLYERTNWKRRWNLI